MTATDTNEAKLERLRQEFANQGLYTLADVFALLREGEMQSFADGNSWVVTRICEFPQKRALEIVLAIGDLPELKKLEEQVMEFAIEQGLDVMIAAARPGFLRTKSDGWRAVSVNYVKELGNASQTAH